MGLRGSVRAFSLEQLLEFLTASGHRGTLSLTHQQTTKTLYLYEGGLYVERSTWSFRLGDVLVRRAEITAAQLDEALAAQKAEGGTPRLGDILVKLGHTTAERILGARRYQVEEEVYELFGWEDAFFEFVKDALPADFEQRIATDPEEFRFDVRGVLLEASRRLDEWQAIREVLPSEKRLLVLSERDGAFERAAAALTTGNARHAMPDDVFSGRTPVGELPRLLGLSRFEAQALAVRLIRGGDVRALQRHELEGKFRAALDGDLPYAVVLYECALESPEFEARGRFLDRVIFGHPAFREAASGGKLSIGAHMSGKRAFEMLLGLFRQGIPCDYAAREERRALSLTLSRSSIVWRLPADTQPPNIIKHLLAKHPVAEADLARAREMQRESGRTLQQILVGGGFVTMDAWFRAQKDAVLDEMFSVLFMRRPFVETRSAAPRNPADSKLDVEVPMLPWLHAEVTREIRQWEVMVGTIPSARSIFALTPKGEKSVVGPEDPLALFDGLRSLEEILALKPRPPAEFFAWVYERIEAGRLRPLLPEEYDVRIDAALEAGKRAAALTFCVAAIETLPDAPNFRDRLKVLQRHETETGVQAARHTLRGDMASFSLAEVLQTFHMGKRSGTLTVEVKGKQGTRSRQIYFDQGDVFLLAGQQDVGKIDSGDDSRILAASNLSEDALDEVTATQMKDEVYEIFLWEGAEFEFAADYLPPEFYASSRRRKVRLKTTKFLLEAVRRIAEWEEVRKVLPKDDVVLAFPSSAQKMEAINRTGQPDLLLLVDGRHPIADLVRISGSHRFKAVSLLAELVRDGLLSTVDTEQRRSDEERAIVATDLPTSGVIEPGFVGQLQFVGTLQDLASAGLTGVLRLTDGRRSKEMALVEGKPFRTQPYRGKAANGAMEAASAVDLAQDVSECFSWQGTRFELLVGTLPPRLADPGTRGPMALEPDLFFDTFAQAGERWGLVAELVPRDKPVSFTSDEAKEAAREKAGESPQLVDLVDGKRSPEDIARVSNRRFDAMSWMATLFEEGLMEVVDASEQSSDESWDLGM